MSFEAVSSQHAAQSQSHHGQAMQSARSHFKSEIDVDEVASDLQSNHSMSSDEQDEQENELKDIVFQLMDEADLDDSNESSVEETSQADAETAVTEQNLKKLSIQQACMHLDFSPLLSG